MQRHFKIIGVVAIVTLMMAAFAEPFAQPNIQLSPRDYTDIGICSMSLNGARSGWDNSSDRSLYVAEAVRRRLTVDACRQLMPTKNLPASTENLPESNETDVVVCSIALDWDRSAWDRKSVPSQKYVAEAARRGLTVRACRQAVGEELPDSLSSSAQTARSESGVAGGWEKSWSSVQGESAKKCAKLFDAFQLQAVCMDNEKQGYNKMQGNFGLPNDVARAAKERCERLFDAFQLQAVCMQNEKDGYEKMKRY